MGAHKKRVLWGKDPSGGVSLLITGRLTWGDSLFMTLSGLKSSFFQVICEVGSEYRVNHNSGYINHRAHLVPRKILIGSDCPSNLGRCYGFIRPLFGFGFSWKQEYWVGS